MRRIEYNAPVTLTFAIAALGVLLLDKVTGGFTTLKFFSVYRCSLRDPLAYVRFFGYVLGHSGYGHYMNNILLMLVIGPSIEEKYGSRNLLLCIIGTALIGGIIQWIFFPETILLGASGIVFMMIVMSSFSGGSSRSIPLTLILVIIFYLGNELAVGLSVQDNISHITHIAGGLCGAAAGFMLPKSSLRQ
jgi:membrane associated rhomboid family serine protease